MNKRRNHWRYVPEATIRHLLLDQVIPRVLGQMGNLVLHASAIRLGDGTGIGFLGDSGWGKSTLAAISYNQISCCPYSCLLVLAQNNDMSNFVKSEKKGGLGRSPKSGNILTRVNSNC